jgi:cytochrome c biogenesis protein CcmG/thiol:disulfide interchange protein DsbE
MSDRRYRIKASTVRRARLAARRRIAGPERREELPMNRFLWPLIGFVVLVALLAVGLNLNPRDVPSPLVGKPAPAFSLPRLDAPEQTFSPKDMLGKVWLLNVWASWCVSCREGASGAGRTGQAQDGAAGRPQLQGSARRRRDRHRQAGARRRAEDGHRARRGWLAKHGDPYTLSVLDIDGRVGIDYGVYGVPETYVIDKAGIIRMKHTGPITPDVFSGKILPLLAELSQ